MSYYMIKKEKMSTPNAAGEEKHPHGCYYIGTPPGLVDQKT